MLDEMEDMELLRQWQAFTDMNADVRALQHADPPQSYRVAFKSIFGWAAYDRPWKDVWRKTAYWWNQLKRDEELGLN